LKRLGLLLFFIPAVVSGFQSLTTSKTVENSKKQTVPKLKKRHLFVLDLQPLISRLREYRVFEGTNREMKASLPLLAWYSRNEPPLVSRSLIRP
jgi:hypothetical protein